MAYLIFPHNQIHYIFYFFQLLCKAIPCKKDLHDHSQGINFSRFILKLKLSISYNTTQLMLIIIKEIFFINSAFATFPIESESERLLRMLLKTEGER